MHPLLVDFGVWRLPLLGEVHLFLASYGLIVALSAVGGWFLFLRLARANGIPPVEGEIVAFWTLVAALAGSKLLLILLDWRAYFEDPRSLLSALRSAGVLMAGVAAGFVVCASVSWLRGLPFWKITDAVAIPLVLAQATGRIGCLLAGCCYGRPAAGLPWAITFTNPLATEYSGTPLGVALHPVQLYQFCTDLALSIILIAIWRRRRFAGQVWLCYMILYGIERGIIELWRGDAVRGVFLGGRLSTSQLFAIASVAAGIALWPTLSRRAADPRHAAG